MPAEISVTHSATRSRKNLTDETILFGNSESGLRFGRPRSFGLEVSYNIGH